MLILTVDPPTVDLALKIAGLAILGIFIVLGIIMVSVIILNKVTSKKEKTTADNER